MAVGHWETKIISVQPGTRGDMSTLDETLREGKWEPFAVTWDGSVWDYHLRKFKKYD